MKKSQIATGLLLSTMIPAIAEGQTLIDLRSQTRNVDFTGAGSTKPMKAGNTLPATCAVGEFFFLTSAPAGSNVRACNPANTWTQQGNLPAVNPGTANQVLLSNGTAAQWVSLGGDISGPPWGMTVSRLQGLSLSSAIPSDGQVLQWNAARNQWEPTGQMGNSSYAFNSQMSITIPGTVHRFGTANLIAECYDGAAPPKRVEPDTVQISQSSYDVMITFSTTQSGYCVVNGVSTGGSGAIASVFGRTGAVSSQTGDYNFAQISGTLGTAQLPAGINAANIGAGTVTNADFGYLANVTSDIQAQLNSKAAATHSNSLNGDLSGNTGAATVVGIQNRGIASTAPADGQALVWSASLGAWSPSSVASSGGASMASQLGDLAVVRTSPTVLTIGANCSSTAPCNARFGYQVFSISNSATATISGGTGTAYVYVNSSGTLLVGHNLTVACSPGCVQQAGTTSFPANVIPIYSWTATNGIWDSAGGHDQRALLATKTVAGGAGIVLTETPGQSTVAVDTGVIPTYLTATGTLLFPAIPAGGCAAGLTLSVTGANPGDAVAPGWPVTLPAGVVGVMLVSNANVVSVRLCNLTDSLIQPPSGTYRATIIRNY